MEHSVNFAQHYTQLVWLLLHEPQGIEEQKAALRALVAASAGGAVSLVLIDNQLQANSARVPAAMTGVTDLALQMTLHGLAVVSIDASAPPAQLLGSARLLAGPPAPDDGGVTVEARRQDLGLTSVRFAARPRSRESLAMLRVQEPPPSLPVAPAQTSWPTPSSNAALPDMEFGDVLDDPFGEAMSRATPRATPAIPPPSGNSSSGMFSHFAAPRVPTSSAEQLLPQLDSAFDPATVTFLLEDLATHAESAARDGKGDLTMSIMSRMARRELEIEEYDARRAFVMTLRRLAKPDVLRAVAARMPHHLEKRDEYISVFTRAGDDGTDVLVEQVAAVEQQRDRRVFYDALIQLKGGVTALLHMLSDPRWYVARNAAELLGEMQVVAAEEPMTALLQHEDDRVRRAATGALMRLGTVGAMQAIEKALVDSAPQMRMEAAAALVTRKDSRASAVILLKALETERDEDVQAAFMLALGKLATPDAVQRLVQASEPERGLFKKKTSAFRVAAVHGLSESRTLEASDALQALHADKDPEVREAAAFARGRIARGAAPRTVSQ